ncbi:MAG: hypothetical protein GAK30_00741 [Paracidovorax wautersii]|uniref:Phospholipid/glycerol acyltransferase domain-containing protein n=1 Tax=Paracidovorax wautersii TaxID=1177982 RepID=A0A7V8FR61_9BURK|nr:MAG: hypothetical protein GAK30_00741 [Paracidovorax wautersii]
MALAAVSAHANWCWRLLGTGLGFVVFGLGGLALRLVVFPGQRWLQAGHREANWARARATVSLSFRLFIGFLARLGVLRCEVSGAERLGRPGQLILANHPSLLDVVILLAQPSMRHSGCIVKQALWRNPCTRGPVLAAGYISNDGSLETLEQSVAQLEQGLPLLIFPEGTRTTPGAAPVFHRGACAIALRGARVLTPVHIRVTPSSLTKNEPWYRIPRERVVFHVEVGEDIDPATWLRDAPMPIAARRLNAHLHQIFSSQNKEDHAAT